MNFLIFQPRVIFAAIFYNMKWYDKDVQMQKKISCMMLRSQKFEAIHVSGILSKLSLPHYTMVDSLSICISVPNTIMFYLSICAGIAVFQGRVKTTFFIIWYENI